MQKVQLGTKVRPLGINRTNVADGYKCRAVLVDLNPRVKYIAWDPKLKKRIEVDQDFIIKYNLRPMTQFYYLIAKLNTDMNGQVVGDQFVVEYLQLSENVNNEFSDSIEEFGNFSSLLLTKVTKKGDNGKDFSYIKVTPSSLQISPEIQSKVLELRNNTQALESMWNLIDRATSITAEEYENLLLDGNSEAPAALPSPKEKVRAQIENKSPMPENDGSFTNQDFFPQGDDFQDGTFTN